MKHFNFLSNLLSLSLGSPCTDVSLDRRLTVGSPSGRYCSGLMRLVFILAILLTVGVGNAWGDYTIIFKDGSGTDAINASTLSNFINSGTSYVTSASSSYMYPSATTGYGIRLASGSYAGNLTLNLSATGQIKASKITFNAAYYGSDASTMPYTITYTDNTTTTGTISTLSTSLADKEVSLTSTKTIKTIYIGTTAKKKRVYVHSITVTAASAYTVTASSSNNTHGTVSVSGTTITATPADCYQVISGTGGYTLNSGTATITHTGTSNTISVTPTANCSITVNFEKKTVNTYVDEIQDNGTTEECDTHDAPSLDDKTPATSGTCAQQHWHFVGWVPAAYKATPRGHITNAGTSMTANGTTYYAVWSKGVAGSDFDGSTEGDYLIYAAVSTTNYYATKSISSGVLSTTTTASSAQTYTFKKSGDYWTISYKSGNTTYYLTAPTGNNVGLNAFSTTSSTWKIATGTYGSWRIWARSTDGNGNNSYAYRALTYNSGTGFKNYCPGSSYYDCEIGAATIYSDSTAICCTALGSINGSFF